MKLLLTLPLLIQGALSWGDVGHRTVAYLAYKYLQPSTQQYIDSIMAYEDGMDISDGAVWPDQIKRQRPKTAPWHFIDARDSPPSQCGVHYPADCGGSQEGCIVTAINQQTAAFIDPSTDPTVRQEALKYILHFVGDIHQPLHVENISRGGNEIQVCWQKACHTNLHSVWDTEIPHQICGLPKSPSHEEEKQASQDWANQLAGGANYESVASVLAAECSQVSDPDTCSLAWAEEANRYVCSYVLKDGISWFHNRDLSTSYYDGAAPIVQDLIGKAGLRLATWLEAMVVSSQGGQQVFPASEQHVLRNVDL